MIDNRHVRSQRLVVLVAKDGTVKKTLAVATDLEPAAGGDYDRMISDIAAYLKRHDVDEVEIHFHEEVA